VVRIVDDLTKFYKFDRLGLSSFPSYFAGHSDNLTKIRHEKVCHINYHSINQLCNQNMVIGIPFVSCKDGLYSNCVLGKHHRDNFEKCTSSHALSLSHIFHSDFCDILSSPSFYRCKYFLNFIDEFYICTWVYFLRLKCEFFDMFLTYKALV